MKPMPCIEWIKLWGIRSVAWVAVALGFGLPAVASGTLEFSVNLAGFQVQGGFHPGAGDTIAVAGTFTSPAWEPVYLTNNGTGIDVYTGECANIQGPGTVIAYKFLLNPGGISQSGAWVWESFSNRTLASTGGSQTVPSASFDDLPVPAVMNATDFLAMADCSLLSFFESNGISYSLNGVQGDALAILRSEGINAVRLRLFTSSASQAQADPYDYINNLAYTLPLASRVKAAGLKLMVDFHFSDTWADPSHQTMPAAWAGLDFEQLTAQVRSYTSNCIAAFNQAGAMPDYVQVGNEITDGMLWPAGLVPGTNAAVQWSNLAQIIQSAIAGMRDAAGMRMPKTVIHIDRGGDWPTTEWFFDNLIVTQQVNFDMIGESYYPFWHGPLDQLTNCLIQTAMRYGKPLLVAETAFPWNNLYWTTNVDGFPASPYGQEQYTAALVQAVKQTPYLLGAGISWWGTEYQTLAGVNEAGFDTTSFFDSQGECLPAALLLGQSAVPAQLRATATGAGLTFSWPLSGSGLSLAENLQPKTSGTWKSLSGATQSMGGLFYRYQDITPGTNAFFRLQSF